MNEIKVFPIGKIENENDETKILLDPAYRAGLKGLGEYSHAQVLWWMDGCDNDKDRGTLVEKKPYAKGPEEIGVFAILSQCPMLISYMWMSRPERLACPTWMLFQAA